MPADPAAGDPRAVANHLLDPCEARRSAFLRFRCRAYQLGPHARPPRFRHVRAFPGAQHSGAHTHSFREFELAEPELLPELTNSLPADNGRRRPGGRVDGDEALARVSAAMATNDHLTAPDGAALDREVDRS